MATSGDKGGRSVSTTSETDPDRKNASKIIQDLGSTNQKLADENLKLISELKPLKRKIHDLESQRSTLGHLTDIFYNKRDTDLKFEEILKILNKFREDITKDVMTKIPLMFEEMKTEVSSINEYLKKTASDVIKEENDTLKQDNQVKTDSTRSYSKALKKYMEIPMVKPLNTERKSKETQEVVRGSIDPATLRVKVDNVRNINNGGIIISFSDANSKLKLKNKVEEKLGDKAVLFAERDDDDLVQELMNLNDLKDTFKDKVRIVKKEDIIVHISYCK
ncbi:hypothetical protein HHI36_006359 [Cryptolaemus montrouzieri]|uniref:Uncharacterized protein n=1 Tax=Cryptolaemus montrouzieri TaxID=559131 RepID=A0ABD2NX50_9CUCU